MIFQDVSERKRREEESRRNAETLAVIDRVENALADERFVLHAQPIVDLASGETVQHELLVRMVEPDGRIVPPAEFLPVCEQYAMIGEIDWWVIKQATRLAGSGCPVQANISARSVGDPDVLEHIERCVEQYEVPRGSLVFEITETTIVEDEGAARTFAERLRRLGCKIALDDFGTGYASLTYLKQMPVDFLKLDIEFVRDLSVSAASRHVVQALVALARDFGLQTVGEGVEDAATLELLAELGVDAAQGYHIARPAPFGERPGDGAAGDSSDAETPAPPPRADRGSGQPPAAVADAGGEAKQPRAPAAPTRNGRPPGAASRPARGASTRARPARRRMAPGRRSCGRVCSQRLVEHEQLGGDVRVELVAAHEGDHPSPGQPLDRLAEVRLHRPLEELADVPDRIDVLAAAERALGVSEHVVHHGDHDVAVVEGRGGGGAAPEVLGMDPDQSARDGGVQLSTPQLLGVGHRGPDLPDGRFAETSGPVSRRPSSASAQAARRRRASVQGGCEAAAGAARERVLRAECVELADDHPADVVAALGRL